VKLKELDQKLIESIKISRFDQYIGKHEGPLNWEFLVQYRPPAYIYKEVSVTEDDWAEFMEISGFQVLLPIARKQHKNVTIERCFPSADEKILTIFLIDSTWESEDLLYYLAVAERLPEQEWFITTLYHERYKV